MTHDDWHALEREHLWFHRIRAWLARMADDPRLTWEQAADFYGCGASTLRLWRGRYWRAVLAKPGEAGRNPAP